MNEERRFKCLLVDDRIQQSGEGSSKFVTAMQDYGLLPGIRLVQLAPEKGGGALAFERVRGDVLTSTGQYDLYLFDIDLDQMTFPAGESWGNAALEELGKTSPSKHFAGLELVNLLDDRVRPKICFTGSPYASLLANAYRLLSARLQDLFICKVNDRVGMAEALKAAERYLLRRQLDILQHQDETDLATIKTQLLELRPKSDELLCFLEEFRLKDLTSGAWSLATLFPVQVNAVRRASDESSRGDALDALELRLLIDWRDFMGTGPDKIGLLNHPQQRWTDSKTRAQIVAIVDGLDFLAVKKSKTYRRFTDLPKFRTMATHPASLRNDVLRQTISYAPSDEPYQVWEYLAMQNGNVKTEKDWADLCQKYGLYAGDIAYICHIAILNKEHGGLSVPPPQFRVVGDNLGLTLEWSYEGGATSKQLLEFKAKIDESRQEAARVLTDEGVGDQYRIVCNRYRGALELSSPTGMVYAEAGRDVNVDPSKRSRSGTRLTVRIPC